MSLEADLLALLKRLGLGQTIRGQPGRGGFVRRSSSRQVDPAVVRDVRTSFEFCGTPGGNRTCAHGLGNHCSIR